MALISALSSHSALIFIQISTGFLAGYVLCRKYRALILRDRWQHYKLTTSFLTLRIFCAVFIVLNSLLWSEATLKEAAVVWFCTALLFLIGACAGFIHGGVMVACGDVNAETSKTLRLSKLRQPKSQGKKEELGRDVEKGEAGSSEDEVTPQEVQKGKQVPDREFKQPTSVLQQQRKYATDKSTRNTTDRQSSLQDTQTRHRPKRKGKHDVTETGDDDTLAEGYSSGYKSESSEDPEEHMILASGDGNTRTEFPHSSRSPTYIAAEFPNEDRITDRGARSKTKKKNDTSEIGSVYNSGSNEHSDKLDNMIPASGDGNTRTEFRHSSRSPTYTAAGFPNENRITDRGTRSKTKKKKKNDTTGYDVKVAIVLSTGYKSGSSEHLEELDHSTGASYAGSASCQRGPRTKRNQIIGKEPTHLSSQRKPKTDNKRKKLPAKESQSQLIHSPLKSLGQHGSTSLPTPEEQNESNETDNKRKKLPAKESQNQLIHPPLISLGLHRSTSLLTPEEQNERNEEEDASRRNIVRNNDDVVKHLDASSSGRTQTSIVTPKPVELRPLRNCNIQNRIMNQVKAHLEEEEARRLAEEEARRLAEEEARRLAKEEARRLAEEEARRLAEEEARRLAEEARRLAEEEARRLAEEARRLAVEEAARRLAEEEAARRLAVEEAARRLAEEEAARRLFEEEEAKLAEERAAKLAKERAAKLAKERADKLAEERAAKLVEEKAAKLAKERADKLAEEKAAKLAKERAAKLVEEKAAKLAKERAAKLVEEKADKLA